MGNKRRNSESAEESGEGTKKPKGPEVEFTGTHFKSLLKEPQSALKGLEQFITLARKLPSPNLYDVVEGYIKISIECVEILKLLDGEKRPESETMLIFQALEAILLRTASDLSHLSVAGVNIVKKMLNTHMKIIYSSVYSETHRMSRICLNLLSAMVTQGPECAREVFSHFDFNNKFLPGLLKRRDKQGRPDVRMAYIQFALSFLISGDNTTIVQIMELNDFIGEIFSTGLKEDRISTINLLLSLLGTKIVHNKAITKTQKVRFFTFAALNHIASLYRWNGIADVSTKEVKDVKDPKEAGKVMVRELVHNFLMDLCCSLKDGINFYDPSLGTAGRAGNLVLLRFLVALKTATEDELVGQLVVNILKVCPDLLSRYFKETQYSFVPRVKTTWLDNIKLLKKIYEAQPEISVAFRTTEFIPIPRLLSMVMITTVAPVCNKAMFTQGLNLPNKIVKHTILSLICSILKRAEKNISHCVKEDIWQKSEIYTPAGMREFSQKYSEALSKLLPDMNTIVATWQSLLKKEGTGTDGDQGEEDAATLDKKEEPSALQELPAATEEQHGSDDVQTTMLKASLLQVLCLYQQVVPHLVAQSNFDFSKLLKGIVTEKGIREEVPPVLQHQILQVALVLPANKFSWFKFKEMPDAGAEKSVFYLLLKMLVTCNKPQLKNSTRLLIIKVLRDSGVFDYTWKELDVWIRSLDKVEKKSKEAVIQFLERILVKLVSNPYPYTDKASESVQEASMLQCNLNKHDSDTVSIPISHIDDVMDMVDVIVEGSEGLDEEVGFALDEDMILHTFPFSAVAPVALEFRNQLLSAAEGENECVVQYLVTVLTDILHSQRDPLALCLMLQGYDMELKDLDASSTCYNILGLFWEYYSLWIPAEAKETLFAGRDCSLVEGGLQEEPSYSSLLKKTYVTSSTSEDNTEEMLKAAAFQLTLEELPLAVRHTLLCFKSTVDNFGTFKRAVGTRMISLYLDLLDTLLCTYEPAKVDQEQQASEESQTEEELFEDCSSINALGTTENTVAFGTPAVEDYKSLHTQLVRDNGSCNTQQMGSERLPVLVVGLFIQKTLLFQILEDVLAVILRHPSLENWFLALSRQAAPLHNLNPISVKLLSSHLNSGVTQLLKSCIPLLQQINSIHLVSKYFEAISESVLKELESASKTLNKKSQQLEALQVLYPYMDVAQLNDITLAILRLPEESLLVMKDQEEPSAEKQLSWYGKVLVQLLTEIHHRKSQQEDLASSVAHVKGVSSLLSSAADELEAVLCEALQNQPALVHVVGLDILTHCLNQMTETCLSIAALLLEHSRTHLLQFELWCLSPGMKKHIRQNSEAYLPLISIYLKCRVHFQFTRPSKVSSAALHVLKEALWNKLLKTALSTETQEESSEQIIALSKLVEVSHKSDLQELLDQVPNILAQSWNQEIWNLADFVSQAVESAGGEIGSWKRSLLTACMKCLTATYTANKEWKEEHQEAEASMLSRLKELMPFVKEDVPEEWSRLVKTGLKYRYKCCAFLGVLKAGIEQWYEVNSPAAKSLVQLPVVHMMVTQHSLFLPTLLMSTEEENAEDSGAREPLVDLLRTLVKKCPSVCDSSHFAVLLGAYGATLSVTDQKILLLLQSYEKNNLSLTDFRLLLWGPAAVEHHKTRKSLGKSLWQQPSMAEILTLIDREKMMKTILHFPIHRKLILEAEKDVLYEDSGIKDLDKIYDPCFLLPLFSELVRPELVVDCVKFIEVNALGFTVAALSSYDYNMRAAANYILSCFISHMEGARFRDKKQLQYLLDIVKSGIRQENQRLTFLLALYIAKAVQLILKPEDHMYIKISRFILSHQYLDMKKVPDFYKLFYSFDFEHKVEREWILGLLSDGLRDKYCYELCDYQRIFLVLLTYYNSPLSDDTSQSQILDVLHNASHITKAAYQLIRDHSLLTWVLFILEKKYLENKLLSNLISLVHNLWITNLGNKLSDLSTDTENKDELAEKQKLLPLHLVNEFLDVVLALLRHVRANLDFTVINQYLSTLSSVLKYRSVVLGAFKEMGRFAVNELVLSSRDALLLLHKWNTVEKNLDLQESLSALAHKHKVKELLSTIKEKYRPHGPRQRKKKLKTEEQTEVIEQQPLTSLEPSRELVKSILIQWEPVFTNPPTTGMCEEADQITQPVMEDVDKLVCDTACMIAKWILLAEGEHSLNPQNLYKSLQWFKKSILPYTPVVEELMKDSMVRSTVFNLYCRVCSGTEMKTSSLDLLQVFNEVMVRLIEIQKLSKGHWHHAVKEKLCLSPDDKPDVMDRAARDFLVSLYVGDIWLCAEELDMFRSHVKAVCEADGLNLPDSNAKTPAQKKEEMQEVIVSLCKDISSTLLNH
ncbi:nucleolar pre-ribosomal-associated protein 1 [Rhinophrynus dorsalis]